MSETIINGTLCPRHRDAGLNLVEDDHCIKLQHPSQQAPIATFSATGASPDEIIKEADKWLDQNRRVQ